MANLQKVLDTLQPYLIGIRYLDKLTVIDVLFKDGWVLPESDVIKAMKGNEDINYYMIFSEKEGIGIDELIQYVQSIIKVNMERESKHELLKQKVQELKDVFKKNSLAKLMHLKFKFEEDGIGIDELATDITDIDEITSQPVKQPIYDETDIAQPIIQQELTEEELERIEEDKRAAAYLKMKQESKKATAVNNVSKKVELPPRKISHALAADVDDYVVGECGCGPEEACDKCMDSKGF